MLCVPLGVKGLDGRRAFAGLHVFPALEQTSRQRHFKGIVNARVPDPLFSTNNGKVRISHADDGPRPSTSRGNYTYRRQAHLCRAWFFTRRGCQMPEVQIIRLCICRDAGRVLCTKAHFE